MPDQALFEAAESGPNASKPLISRASSPPSKTPTALLLLLDMGDGYPHDRLDGTAPACRRAEGVARASGCGVEAPSGRSHFTGAELSLGAPRVHCAAMTVDSLPWPSRLWLSWVSAFRILFDGAFAARVAALGDEKAMARPEPVPPSSPGPTDGAEALQLLSLLQREGRFVDFVEQDITTFSDQDVGAAARVVHEGCRRALHAHARIESVRGEAEGSRVTLEQADRSVKLVGSVAGSAPYRGVLRHRGWRVQELKLPTRIGEHDPKLLAPAELELS